MISAKKSEKEHISIEIQGSNLQNLDELMALIDSVTKVVFKDNDRARRSFIKEIPYIILDAHPTMTKMELPCSPEDLKKFGGENT